MEEVSNANRFAEWFFFFLGVFWFGSVAIMSLAGGWHRLAASFRASSRVEGETFRFASMYIRAGVLPVSYANCLSVTVSPSGVRLSPVFLLRFLHPPLFIPWSAILAVRPEDLESLRHTAVYLRGFDTRLLFTEPVAKKLVEAFNARYSTMPA